MDDIHVVDRKDQVKWFMEPWAFSFIIKVTDNHKAIYDWLKKMSTGTIVISGEGVMPRLGTFDHPAHSIFENIQNDIWKIYFENEKDALAFKLAWSDNV